MEIDGLKSRNESLVILVQESSKQQSTDKPVSVNQETKKSVMDNTNEILILKNKISDLEQKLSLAEVRQSYRRRFNSESQDSKMEQILVNGSLVNGGSGQIDDKMMKDLKSDLDNCQNQLKSKASEIAGLTSINERLKLEVEEKVHDLKMAQKNMDHLKEMLEEKSNTTESQQQERLQNIAGT